MKKGITIILTAVCAGAMSASAQILVGFEAWTVNNPNGGVGIVNAATTSAAGFSGDSITATTGWGRSASGANADGTFGTVPGADTTVAFNRGLSLNNGANGAYDFTVTNGTGNDYNLDFFHFDTGTFRPNAAHEWTVSVLSGALTAGAVQSGSADNITGGVTDWYDYDIDLSGLADNVLEAGQTVTFRLDMAGGITTSGHHQYVDNIAVSGTVVPEPGTLGLLVVSAGGMFVFRRTRLMR